MSTDIPRDHVKIRVITWRDFGSIVFPIYLFPCVYDASMEDGLLHVGDYIVDDLNMSGNTLGLRRLQSPHNKQLYKLSRPLFNFSDVFYNKRGSIFIASDGTIIRYKRTQYAIMQSEMIHRVTSKDEYSEMYLKGYSVPWIIPRPPPSSMLFVTVLKVKGTILSLLRYTTLPEEPVKRKI